MEMGMTDDPSFDLRELSFRIEEPTRAGRVITEQVFDSCRAAQAR